MGTTRQHALENQEFTDEDAEGRRTGYGQKARCPERAGDGHGPAQTAHVVAGKGVVTGQDVACQQKEHALGQGMANSVQQRALGRQSAKARAQSQNAHVFHAGIGQQAFVMALAHNEDGGGDQGEQAEKDQQPAAEAAQVRRQHDLVPAQYAQQGAVEQRAGKQGRNQGRGLTVGVGQPVVQGGQTHLGAVAHQQKDECRLEPGLRGRVGVPDEPAGLVHVPGRNFASSDSGGRVKGHGKQNVAQQGQGDAHGTDDQVFPGGFQGALMAVKIDQRRTGQRGGFNAHPERPQMRRGGHQAHGREKKAETGREAALGRVGEGAAVLNAGALLNALFLAQIAQGVD